MYRRYLKEVPSINFTKQSVEEICGTFNSFLLKYPNNVAKSAFVNYIEYLYSNLKVKNPLVVERLRVKKNNIIANIEVPKNNSEYKLDLEKFFINKLRLISVLKKMSPDIKYLLILVYDGALRINELLLNKWSNISEDGILIPKSISKSGRDRYVEWLMKESSLIVKKLKPKKDCIVEDTFHINYFKLWWRLKKLGDVGFNPHCLRHTRLTDLASVGWELGKLQRRAGHSDPKITQYYISWVSSRKGDSTLEDYCNKHNINLYP